MPFHVTVGANVSILLLTPFVELAMGDILAAGEDGVGVVRDGDVVARPIDTPTVRAFVASGSSIVFHGPIAGDYPDRWPPTILLGEPVVRIIHSDGRIEILYEGGDWHHLFGLAEVPAVAEGHSLLLVRSDVVDDFPFRTDSIVVVPLNGSPPHRLEEVAGFESIITGLAWMDAFFAVAFAGEGIEAFDALDLDGQRVPWPENPEPAETRDFAVHVANLTRVGVTSVIVYTRTTGFAFEETVDLVRYDTDAGIELSAIPLFEAGFDATAISASIDAVVVSGIRDTGAGDWPFAQDPLVVFSPAAPEGAQIDVIGSGSIVGP